MKRDQAADRQAFEQFMLQRNACTRLARQSDAVGGQYRTVTVQRAWELWQAAVKHAENCAAALGSVTPEPAPSTPWYPDDSGEWVEVPEDLMEMPIGLKARTLVSVLFREERQRKSWASVSHSASAVLWIMPASCHTRIVAYKVVKP